MWLVADSGSTKTEWVLFDPKEKEKLFTVGLNPLFLTNGEFKAVLRKSIPREWVAEVTKLWFYGAGCGLAATKEEVARWLSTFFTKAIIEVDSDLMAAARATYQRNRGIVAIVGTGSNTCFYNGKDITQLVKPLGYILGDEGSGAALGKQLLKKLLRNQLSSKLTSAIYQSIEMEYDEILNRVYGSSAVWSEQPNRFIASFAKVLHKFKEEAEIEAILLEEFDNLSNILTNYLPEINVNVVGSVGYYFKNTLAESFKKKGLIIGKVVASPGDGLVEFHLNRT